MEGRYKWRLIYLLILYGETKIMYQNNNNNMFMDAVNILSLILQMQNAESFKVDQVGQRLENKIDKDINSKLDEILNRLDQIEEKLRLTKNSR